MSCKMPPVNSLWWQQEPRSSLYREGHSYSIKCKNTTSCRSNEQVGCLSRFNM